VIVIVAALIWRTSLVRLEGPPTAEERPARVTDPTGSERTSDVTDDVADGTPRPTQDGRSVMHGQAAEQQAAAAREVPSVGDAARLSGESLTPGPGGPYVIFVSSHRLRGAAENQVASLASRGVAAAVSPADIEGRGTWFRVAVEGGYPRIAEAREALAVVHALGHEGAWIEWRKAE
jgi:hypothetical protein